MAPAVVQMRTPAESALIERFEAEKAGLPGAAAERAAAFERFKAKGLPSKRVEAYHYTDLRALMRQAPEAGSEAVAAPRAPAGVTIQSLAEALAARLRAADAAPAVCWCGSHVYGPSTAVANIRRTKKSENLKNLD